MAGLSDLLFAVVKSKGTRRLSAVNRLSSYLAVRAADTNIVSLHNDLETILKEHGENWPYYDYGEGYFYQSYPPLFINGLRNTDFRFKLYRLGSILRQDMKVLDIGCNAGFLSLMIAKHCGHIDAFDNNPFLIRAGERCREFEDLRNISFSCAAFNEFKTSSRYDVVLSLANHHTFDGNMRPEFGGYMGRIRGIMKAGGQLIFESHPGEHKTPFLRQQLDSLQDIFKINSETAVSTRKSIYDTNRLVVWMEAI